MVVFPTPFQDEVRWSRLMEVVEEWLGTPYRHLMMEKGRGADCTLFLVACLKEVGIVVGDFEYQYYPKDWHIHTKSEIVKHNVIDFLFSHLASGLRAMWMEKPKDIHLLKGDLLGFSTTKTGVTNHMALYCGDDKMVHSIQGRGVSFAHFGDWWKRRLNTIFRIIEV